LKVLSLKTIGYARLRRNWQIATPFEMVNGVNRSMRDKNSITAVHK